MITYPRFQALLSDVPDCASLEEYIAVCGGAVPVDSAEEAICILNAVWTMAHDGLTIRSIAAACEMPIRHLAIAIDLPVRTVENWASEVRKPPRWQLPLISYAVLSEYMGE